jgi:hypothetical protein
MKTILVALALWVTIGCTSYRELQQIDMVQVQVVKIDTIWRHPGQMKQLTWKDSDDIEYISFVSLGNEVYSLGSSMYVLKKR